MVAVRIAIGVASSNAVVLGDCGIGESDISFRRGLRLIMGVISGEDFTVEGRLGAIAGTSVDRAKTVVLAIGDDLVVVGVRGDGGAEL